MVVTEMKLEGEWAGDSSRRSGAGMGFRVCQAAGVTATV